MTDKNSRESEGSRELSPFDRMAADRMAAAVDDLIRRGLLDARSVLADARLDYGNPFDEETIRKLISIYQE